MVGIGQYSSMDKRGDNPILTAIHSGCTAVIVGTSPERPPWPDDWDIDPNIIKIGVNNAPVVCELDYWLVCDTHRIFERMRPGYEALTGHEVRLYNAMWPEPRGCMKPHYYFGRPQGGYDEHYQPTGAYSIPKAWDGTLQHVWSSATAALNLAMVMGCDKAILFGVDFTGHTRTLDDVVPWSKYLPDIQKFISKLDMPVYKTNPDSELALPCWTLN